MATSKKPVPPSPTKKPAPKSQAERIARIERMQLKQMQKLYQDIVNGRA